MPGLLRILCIGDSLTWGWPDGPGSETSYQPRLSRLLRYAGVGHELLVEAISGQTTADVLPWAPDKVRQHRPDLVLLDVGQNDAGRLLPGFEQRYLRLVAELHAAHPGVVVLGAIIQGSILPGQQQAESAVQASLRRLAVPPQVAAVADMSTLPKEYLRGDLGHPTIEGYAARAWKWFETIAEHLKLPT